MGNRSFKIPRSTSTKLSKTADALDVAARYFVYGLYEATGGRLTEQRALRGIGEAHEAVLRAVERGWATLQGEGSKRSAALTEEGRKVARKGR